MELNLPLQVDSANKHGILLEVVQILTDLNLSITKAYISSDGGWFMDGNNFFFALISVILYIMRVSVHACVHNELIFCGEINGGCF